MKKPIIGFVGPSGAGKSTLIVELVRNFSDRLAVIKSLTTRARRGQEDDLFYQFVSADEVRKRETEGRLIQVSEYAGNLYANDQIDLDKLLEYKCGLLAIVEEGVEHFRSKGYTVIVINIIPEDNPAQKDLVRKTADEMRSQLPLNPDLEVVNSFKEGGREEALGKIIEFVRRIT
jgi:guanylate kinase